MTADRLRIEQLIRELIDEAERPLPLRPGLLTETSAQSDPAEAVAEALDRSADPAGTRDEPAGSEPAEAREADADRNAE